MSRNLFLWVCLHDLNLWVAGFQAINLLFWQLFSCLVCPGKLEGFVQWLGLITINSSKWWGIYKLEVQQGSNTSRNSMYNPEVRYIINFCCSCLWLGSHEFSWVYPWIMSMRLLNSQTGIFIHIDKFYYIKPLSTTVSEDSFVEGIHRHFVKVINIDIIE